MNNSSNDTHWTAEQLAGFTARRIEAQAADDAWSAELTRSFGKKAGDVRYTPAGEGEPGSALRLAYDRYKRAHPSAVDVINPLRDADNDKETK